MDIAQDLVLGIETSCDETSAAVLSGGSVLLSHVTSSQIDVHQVYGGVVPEIASREHCLHIDAVVDRALGEAGVRLKDLGAVAVTFGPGLVGSLLVGVAYAKALAYARGLKFIGVNHLEAHVLANLLEHPDMAFPVLALLVSGGHTNYLYFEDYLTYRVVGRTRDDAAGEAFDKVARALKLGYPGGPHIEKAAQKGRDDAYALPRSLLEPGSLDFSFSGLKSAVLNQLNSARMRGDTPSVEDMAASFQRAVIDVLVTKTHMALERFPQARTLALAGGVAANGALGQAIEAEAMQQGVDFCSPSLEFCTDNGAMVAVAGYCYNKAGRYTGWNLNAVPGLKLTAE
ncbi:MAG: tRNA (adenosine(37)-N6)-threonylcarbamoyltransferase complex transferase subunit TsaD [Peptococcaceae bacterium]|nr:tRNA (adenosine(37)-N6)-threonylcarbamoyltransferase complex transferase subunit TsaD [Peptococcaceae bacterium]